MRSTSSTVVESMDKIVVSGISDMWQRLNIEALTKKTSLGAIASAKGISGSAIYSAMRANRDGRYIDTLLDQIVIIADALEMDIDEAITGEPIERKSIMDEVNVLLEEMDDKAAEALKTEVLSRITL